MNINMGKNGLNINIDNPSVNVGTNDNRTNVNAKQNKATIDIKKSKVEVKENTVTIRERNHKNLENLDFENSGHTGFQPAGDYVLKTDVPETLYALGADYAEYFEWEDGNPNKENRTSLFVSVVSGTRKIKKAMEGEDILGITSIDASVIGNARYKNEETYSPVGMTGVMKVKDNGQCVVGNYVVPGDNGIAIPSTNDAGYKVTTRYDANTIEVLLAHDAEMISRIRKDIENIKVDVDLSDYYNKEEIDNKIENINIPDVDLSNYYNKGEIDGLASELVGMIPDVDLSEYYNKSEIDGLANELVGMMPSKTSQLENDNNFVTGATLGQMMTSRPTYSEIQPIIDYRIGLALDAIPHKFLPENATEGSVLKYQNGQWLAVPETSTEDEILTVNYQINPQTMEIISISHYSNDIVDAYNEGKKVTFRGYVLGLGVYVNSELEMVDGNYALTFPLIRGDLGLGTMNYLFNVLIMPSSTRVTVHVLQEITQ